MPTVYEVLDEASAIALSLAADYAEKTDGLSSFIVSRECSRAKAFVLAMRSLPVEIAETEV